MRNKSVKMLTLGAMVSVTVALGGGTALAQPAPEPAPVTDISQVPPNTIRVPVNIPGLPPYFDIATPSQADIDNANKALANASKALADTMNKFNLSLDKLNPTERQVVDFGNQLRMSIEEFGKNSPEAKAAAKAYKTYLEELKKEAKAPDASDEVKAIVGKGDKDANKESKERIKDADITPVLKDQNKVEKEADKEAEKPSGEKEAPKQEDTPAPEVTPSTDDGAATNSSSNKGRAPSGYVK